MLLQYALEKLGDGEAAEAEQRRHARYFQRTAEAAERALSGPAARTYLMHLVPERDNCTQHWSGRWSVASLSTVHAWGLFSRRCLNKRWADPHQDDRQRSQQMIL